MSLILSKLTCAILDPIVQTQRHLSKLPQSGVGIMINPELTIHLQCVKDKGGAGDRIYALSTLLGKNMNENHIKNYAVTPFRTATGNVGVMITNMYSNDAYSVAKRSIIQSRSPSVFTVERQDDGYLFSASTQPIEPISQQEFEAVLDLYFGDSVIDSSGHPVYEKLTNTELGDKSAKVEAVSVSPVERCQITGIDLTNLDLLDI